MIKVKKSNGETLSTRLVSNIENKIGYMFPLLYRDLVINGNGGDCVVGDDYDLFKFSENTGYGPEEVYLSRIYRLWNVNFEDDVDAYTQHRNLTSAMMPYELWPFAESINGNVLLIDLGTVGNPIYMHISGLGRGWRDIPVAESLVIFNDAVYQGKYPPDYL